MTLGENISRLRRGRHMSQGDLADALGVSRQSVSKWETNSSVPDLDKLVGLSRLFEISLDELVCGDRPEEGGTENEGEPEPPKISGQTPQQLSQSRIVLGGVLLGVGLLGLLLLVLLAGVGGLLVGLLFTLPLILCGILCLKVRRRLGLWCAWAVYLPQQVYWTMATGITWQLVLSTPYFTPQMNYTRLLVGWLMLVAMVALAVATVRSFAEHAWGPNPGRILLTMVLWLAALFSWVLYSLVFLLMVGPDGRISIGLLAGLIQGLFAAGQTAALAAALTLTLSMVRSRKSPRSDCHSEA